MTQLEHAKKAVRRALRRYKQHAHNSRWRLLADEVHADFLLQFPGKAAVLQEVFLSGKSRHRRMSYQAIADQQHVSVGTVSVWIDEIVQEVMVRAAKERLI